MRNSRIGFVVVAVLLVPCVAVACMWDYDTIKMERSRFPTTLELITGKFLRHSPEFYQWRIADRHKKLEADPTNAAYHDDLAVAYDKTGQTQKAIDTMLKLEKLHPGRYETTSNLATFYFHAGRLTDSVPLLDKALAINPEAHFGREKYQKYLTEYVLSRKRGDALTLPLTAIELGMHPGVPIPQNPVAGDFSYKDRFADYLTKQHETENRGASFESERSAAIKGVLGMMRFANHQSPVLLEALGTLLAPSYTDPETDAKLLAARAYLKASYEVPEGPSRQNYRRMAEHGLNMQTPARNHSTQISLEQVETQFQKELAEAREWYAELRENELSWIRDGKDPEVEFDKLYEQEPEVSGMDVTDPLTVDEALRQRMGLLTNLAIIGVGVWIVIIGGSIIWWVRRGAARRTPPDAVTPPTS